MTDIDELLNQLDRLIRTAKANGGSGVIYSRAGSTIRQLKAKSDTDAAVILQLQTEILRLLARIKYPHHTPANTSEFKRGQEVMREAAAKLIEGKQEAMSMVCNGRFLQDRVSGNLLATAYAPAIRNLPIGE
jgi:hypothetical protein